MSIFETFDGPMDGNVLLTLIWPVLQAQVESLHDCFLVIPGMVHRAPFRGASPSSDLRVNPSKFFTLLGSKWPKHEDQTAGCPLPQNGDEDGEWEWSVSEWEAFFFPVPFPNLEPLGGLDSELPGRHRVSSLHGRLVRFTLSRPPRKVERGNHVLESCLQSRTFLFVARML